MRGDLQKLLLGRIFMIDSSFPDSGFRILGRVALNSLLLTSLLWATWDKNQAPQCRGQGDQKDGKIYPPEKSPTPGL